MDIKLKDLVEGDYNIGDKWYCYLKTSPFWSLRFTPKSNPFGLFTFVSLVYKEFKGVLIYALKTEFGGSPVISKYFTHKDTLQSVVKWIEEQLSKIKQELDF